MARIYTDDATAWTPDTWGRKGRRPRVPASPTGGLLWHELVR